MVWVVLRCGQCMIQLMRCRGRGFESRKMHAFGNPAEVKATWLEPDSPVEEALGRHKVWLFSSLFAK